MVTSLLKYRIEAQWKWKNSDKNISGVHFLLNFKFNILI
jgi:ribosome-associated toxin RatA of RatAB toxin-antitoxin module